MDAIMTMMTGLSLNQANWPRHGKLAWVPIATLTSWGPQMGRCHDVNMLCKPP